VSKTATILTGFSRGLSYLAHPLLLPTLSVWFLSSLPGFHAVSVESIRWLLLLLVFLFTFIIPVLLVTMLKVAGRVESLQMENRAERMLPYLLTAIVYYFTYRYLIRSGLPTVYGVVVLGATTMIITALIINIRWKISIHMMGIGGACGLLHGLTALFWPTIILVALAGFVGFARLFLGSHRHGEIYGGFVIGYLLFFVLFAYTM